MVEENARARFYLGHEMISDSNWQYCHWILHPIRKKKLSWKNKDWVYQNMYNIYMVSDQEELIGKLYLKTKTKIKGKNYDLQIPVAKNV